MNRALWLEPENLLKYIVETFDDDKIIYIKLSGDLYSDEFKAISKDFRLKATELNYKLIFDFRETTNYIRIADAYFWFDSFYDFPINLRKIGVAHLVNDENEPFFNFFRLLSS